MSKPVTPDEVDLGRHIPSEVIDAFNERIRALWNGREAIVHQSIIVAAILNRMPSTTRQRVFDEGWLNVEGRYREAGWLVEYEPDYNENYESVLSLHEKVAQPMNVCAWREKPGATVEMTGAEHG